jgi:small-conductance mechanosensitive channel
MLDALFVAAIAALISGLLYWGVKTLPAERWQMIAAVPTAKTAQGAWRGVNLTFYGFFSATGMTFGVALAVLLISSMRMPLAVAAVLVAATVAVCLPASRLVAAIVERKRNTFTIAGAAFVASLLVPPAVWFGERALRSWAQVNIFALPLLAAAAIAYAMAEAIGRLACISFGCCYGMPLRQAPSWLTRLFARHNLVLHGRTKKAAYASGLDEEPLVPVQAVTSIVFALSGFAGLILFLTQRWRWALIIPVIGTWGWRALAENLRADHRGHSRISVYQIMSLIGLSYLIVAAFVIPAEGSAPDLALGLSQVSSTTVVVLLQVFWIAMFLYYGRSRVTGSTVSFHVNEKAI